MKTLFLALAVMLSPQMVSPQEILTNDSIVKMVNSGLGENLIVSMVQNQPGKYSLSPDEVLKLKKAGVSEKILTAMANKGTGGTEGSSGLVKVELKTPVRLIVDEPLSSKTSKAGETFRLVAAEDVLVDGKVVVAKGSSATGRITLAEKKSAGHHHGKLEVTVDSVRAVDGHNIPLEGRLGVGGSGRMARDAKIEKGESINAVVANETEVKLRSR